MSARTYRVQVIGQFHGLDDDTRAELRRRQPEHDVFESAFTPQGSFTYGPSLTRFTLRYLLVIDRETAVEADAEAALEAELRALDELSGRGITHQPLVVSATCVEDVTARRSR